MEEGVADEQVSEAPPCAVTEGHAARKVESKGTDGTDDDSNNRHRPGRLPIRIVCSARRITTTPFEIIPLESFFVREHIYLTLQPYSCVNSLSAIDFLNRNEFAEKRR